MNQQNNDSIRSRAMNLPNWNLSSLFRHFSYFDARFVKCENLYDDEMYIVEWNEWWHDDRWTHTQKSQRGPFSHVQNA